MQLYQTIRLLLADEELSQSQHACASYKRPVEGALPTDQTHQQQQQRQEELKFHTPMVYAPSATGGHPAKGGENAHEQEDSCSIDYCIQASEGEGRVGDQNEWWDWSCDLSALANLFGSRKIRGRVQNYVRAQTRAGS